MQRRTKGENLTVAAPEKFNLHLIPYLAESEFRIFIFDIAEIMSSRMSFSRV